MTTPNDPTQAQVWVTKDGDELDFEFYIPQGPKGEPGGLVNTVVAQNTDLDAYLTPGIYSITNGADDGASALAHLPMNEAGTLLVTASQTGSIQIQTYITNTKGIYVRRRFNSVWNAWRHFGHTRVDQTAGRVMYQWDNVNQREQIIYGDTGRRDITASFPSPSAGKVYLSRYGNYVNFIFADYQDGTAGTSLSVPAGTIPVGFRPQNWLYQPAASSRLVVFKADGGLTMSPHSATVWQGGFTWRTEDPWPTTLPGTAVGSIPSI